MFISLVHIAQLYGWEFIGERAPSNNYLTLHYIEQIFIIDCALYVIKLWL